MAAGNRKKPSGVHFFQKRGLFSLFWTFENLDKMFLLILTSFRMLKIAGRVILKIRNSSATTILLMSRTMKIRKLKLFYCQKDARYRAKELWRDIFLGNLSLKEGKNSVGLPVLILEFWWRHVQTKNKSSGTEYRDLVISTAVTGQPGFSLSWCACHLLKNFIYYLITAFLSHNQDYFVSIIYSKKICYNYESARWFECNARGDVHAEW